MDLADASANGLIDSKPYFNSVSRYLSDPALTDTLKRIPSCTKISGVEAIYVQSQITPN